MMLGLIAGTGALPSALAGALAVQGRQFVVCEMRGFAAEGLPDTPKIGFRFEHLGTLIQTLVDRGVGRVCFAGAVSRPQVDPTEIDAATLPLVPRLMAAIAAGDDGALRGIIAVFEEAGLSVVAAHEIAPDLLPVTGLLAGPPVTPDVHSDIGVAIAEHLEMSAADVGQAVVVAGGRTIAREGQDGTDAMLTNLIPPPDENAGSWWSEPFLWPIAAPIAVASYVSDWIGGFDTEATSRGPATGGLLYKAPKLGQDRRADLPVIGPRTVMLAAEAGISTVVIEASGVMVLDQPQVRQIAEAMNMRLWVREAEQ